MYICIHHKRMFVEFNNRWHTLRSISRSAQYQSPRFVASQPPARSLACVPEAVILGSISKLCCGMQCHWMPAMRARAALASITSAGVLSHSMHRECVRLVVPPLLLRLLVERRALPRKTPTAAVFPVSPPPPSAPAQEAALHPFVLLSLSAACLA